MIALPTLDPKRKENLFEDLIRIRDEQRNRDGFALLKGKDLQFELNRWGYVKWYMHPSVNDTVTKTLIVWVMKIPPKSKTGKLLCQGGHIYYVWKGTRGHTTINNAEHKWGAKCVIDLPIIPNGITVQHFNDGDDTVELIGTEENLVDALNVDKGSGFEILEPCPEWTKEHPEQKK